MRKLFIFLFLSIVIAIVGIAILFIKDRNPSEKTVSMISQKTVQDVTVEPQNVKIVAIGDSLTEGVGDSTEQGGYIPYLQSMLEKEKDINKTIFYNFGKKGIRSDQLLKNIQTDEVVSALRDADMVILTIGGNDMMKVVRENLTDLQKTDFEEQKQLYQANLSATIDYIKQVNHRGQIVLIGLYNPFYKWFPEINEMNEVVNDWNLISQEILANYPSTTYFIDIMDIFENEEENLLYTDYFHPNNRGYELIAGEVFEELSEEVMEELIQQKWIVQSRGRGE